MADHYCRGRNTVHTCQCDRGRNHTESEHRADMRAREKTKTNA